MSLRLVMMGTGEFALPAFSALYNSPHEVIGLCTQPDRTGRGHHRHVNPIKELALEHGTPVLQPHNVNCDESLTDLRELGADIYVVAAYGQLLSAELLAIPQFGAVNLHASLLPRHRGATPVHYALLSGDSETGVSIFQIDPGLDAGPILGVVSTEIGVDETTGALELRLAQLAAPLTCTVLDQIEAGIVKPVAQDASLSTRAPRFKKNFGLIDWSRPAVEIERHIRAMQPWPKAYTFLRQPDDRDIRLIILSAQPSEQPCNGPPGTIASTGGDRLLVTTGEGSLELLRLRPEGKGDMGAIEFRNGYRVGAESRLVTSRPEAK